MHQQGEKSHRERVSRLYSFNILKPSPNHNFLCHASLYPTMQIKDHHSAQTISIYPTQNAKDNLGSKIVRPPSELMFIHEVVELELVVELRLDPSPLELVSLMESVDSLEMCQFPHFAHELRVT